MKIDVECLRAALPVLGWVSNLPTVWSNRLAGWLRGGGGPATSLRVLCLGANC